MPSITYYFSCANYIYYARNPYSYDRNIYSYEKKEVILRFKDINPTSLTFSLSFFAKIFCPDISHDL